MHSLPACLIAALLLLVALPAQADWLLLQRVTDANGDVRPAYTWVGEERLRHDNGRFTLIADLRADTLDILDHERRTVTRRPLPQARATGVPAQGLSSETVRDWTATRYRWETASGAAEVTGWFTEQEPAAAQAWQRAQRRLTALLPDGFATPDAEDVRGLPVRLRIRRTRDGRVIGERETLVILQRDPYPATYRVPGGYERVQAASQAPG